MGIANQRTFSEERTQKLIGYNQKVHGIGIFNRWLGTKERVLASYPHLNTEHQWESSETSRAQTAGSISKHRPSSHSEKDGVPSTMAEQTKSELQKLQCILPHIHTDEASES